MHLRDTEGCKQNSECFLRRNSAEETSAHWVLKPVCVSFDWNFSVGHFMLAMMYLYM